MLDNYRRKLLKRRNKKKLKNINPTVVSSNCNGALILHDLGLKFNSPFVNLWIKPKDFLKLLGNMKEYMDAELVEVKEEEIDYPVGMLLDIYIYICNIMKASIRQKKNGMKEKRE